MPRNSSGTYSLPSGNPVVPDTLIETSWANPTLEDIALALTNSLDRTGSGSMLDSMYFFEGTVIKPGISFSAETNSGIYREATKSLGISIGGTKVAGFTDTGISLLEPVTFAGQLLVPPATVGAPSIAFTDNHDTGIFEPESDVLGIATAGVERMRVDQAGRVGIGGGNVATLFVGQNAGNVSSSVARFDGLDTANGSFISIANSGTNLGFVGGGVALATGAGATDFGLNSMGALVFATNSYQERMRIDVNGAVGIGKVPSVRLDVQGQMRSVFAITTAYQGGITLEGGGVAFGNRSPVLEFSAGNVNAGIWSTRYASFGGDLVLATQGSGGGNPAERMRIDTAGKVGIGGAPTATLDVFGGNDNYMRITDTGQTRVGFFQARTTDGTIAIGALSNHPLALFAGNAERMRIDAVGAVTMPANPAAGDNSTRVPNTSWVQANLPGGMGQVYAASGKAFGTSYSNGTNKPRLVGVSLSLGSGATVQLLVGGIVVQQISNSNSSSISGSMFAIVPPGVTYQLSGTASTIVCWAEC